MALIRSIRSAATAGILALAAAAAGAGDTCDAKYPWSYRLNFLMASGKADGTTRAPSYITHEKRLMTGKTMVVLMPDGNVMVQTLPSIWHGPKTLWQSNTGGSNATRFGFVPAQSGNSSLCAYKVDAAGAPSTVWCAPQSVPTATGVAVLMEDCDLGLFAAAPLTGEVWRTDGVSCVKAHVVTHSHDDVGWLLTPERYYDGCYSTTAGVQGIIGNMVETLVEDPKRKYTQVESYFFHRWWVRQNETTKAVVRRLVQQGRWEFINGGWSMHDEACVHQESAIANMAIGAQWLKQEFGDAAVMKIGWHIDPFGHASATPRYMAEMGFDAFFFWRTDYQHKAKMVNEKTIESVWENSPSLGAKTRMLTSILYNSYCWGCEAAHNGNAAYGICPGKFDSYSCEVMGEYAQAEAHAADAAVRRVASARRQHAEIAAFDQASSGRVAAAKVGPVAALEKAAKAAAEVASAKVRRLRDGALLSMRTNPVLLHLAADHRRARGKTTRTQVARQFGAQFANIDTRIRTSDLAAAYAKSVKNYNKGFRGGRVMMPWGCDFAHNYPAQDYAMMDAIITEINANSDRYGGVTVEFSTVGEYVKELQKLENHWPVNKHDYFLDSDNGHAYWSGYLSSRAEYKGYERKLMGERAAAEKMVAQAVLSATTPVEPIAVERAIAQVFEFDQVMGIAQHHDSITGTEREHVRNQYQFLLARGMAAADDVTTRIVAKNAAVGVVTRCHLANLSSCPATMPLADGQDVTVIVTAAGLANARDEWVTIPIPVDTAAFYVNGVRAAADITATWALTKTVDLTSPVVVGMPFQAYVRLTIPAGGLVSIVIRPAGAAPAVDVVAATRFESFSPALAMAPPSVTLSIENDAFRLTFGADGLLAGIENKFTGERDAFEQNIERYCPHNQTESAGSTQASGAYIFRTCRPNEMPVAYTTKARQVRVARGTNCQEVRVVLDEASNIHQQWRLCAGQVFVEHTMGIGEVETLTTGVEIISRIKARSMRTGSTWFVDSQGLESQRRVRDSRPNYDYNVTEPVTGNFFPSNAFAFLNDTVTGTHLAVLTDRSRATASLADGELQFLVQRRLTWDDGRGVGQALDEDTRVLSTNRIYFGAKEETMRFLRIGGRDFTHPPLPYFAADSSVAHHAPAAEAPAAALPPQVHVHSAKLAAPGTLIVRVQHLFAVGEGTLARPVTFDLLDAAVPFVRRDAVTSVLETDTNGVVARQNIARADFPTCDAGEVVHIPSDPFGGAAVSKDATTVELAPMQMRTFVVTVAQ